MRIPKIAAIELGHGGTGPVFFVAIALYGLALPKWYNLLYSNPKSVCDTQKTKKPGF